MADEKLEDLPEELTIELRKAVEFASVTFDKLILREPTAGQILEWAKFEAHEAEVKAVAIVSGVPEAAVKLIGARDFKKAVRYIERFLQ